MCRRSAAGRHAWARGGDGQGGLCDGERTGDKGHGVIGGQAGSVRSRPVDGVGADPRRGRVARAGVGDLEVLAVYVCG